MIQFSGRGAPKNPRVEPVKPSFVLDRQLVQDCFVLGRLHVSRLLLLNNALVPWFVLVPETEVVEWFELDVSQQHIVLDEINVLSAFVKAQFGPEKLNVATIGNKVRQMHIHVVGRSSDDYCWPGVVWGAKGSHAYIDREVGEIRSAVAQHLGELFSPAI